MWCSSSLRCTQVVREDKVEHYPISRSVRPNGKPGHHFILNDVIRLWLACCVDEVVAEILTVPELRWAYICLARSLGGTGRGVGLC